jgi:peptidylprolyl isomerase
MKTVFAFFLLLFAFFVSAMVAADLQMTDPSSMVTESYKLMFSGKHCGWMTVGTKIAAGVMTYDQEFEIGPFSEQMTIKAKKSGLQAVVITTKFEQTSGKLVALLEDKPKKYKGTWGKAKHEYELGPVSFLPARSERFASMPEVGWEEDKELAIADLMEEKLDSAKPGKVKNDDGTTTVKLQGEVSLDKDGKVVKIVFEFPFGSVEALPCEAKEMKPTNQKEVQAMFDEKVFFAMNNGYFEITGYGTVEFSFLFDAAPKHCARIRHLIETGYYNGKNFHRLAPLEAGNKGRILQGGSSDGKGYEGCKDGKTVPLEANAKHDAGTIGMARTMDPHSANAQFYFNLDSVHGLDGKYTVWGKVEKGMDILEKIWADNYKGASDSMPKNNVVIGKAGITKK